LFIFILLGNRTPNTNRIYESINVGKIIQKPSNSFNSNVNSVRTLDTLLHGHTHFKKFAWTKP